MSKLISLIEMMKDAKIDPVRSIISSVSDMYRLSDEELKEVKGMLIADNFRLHYESNNFYRRVCDEKGVTPSDIKGYDDIIRIPLIPIEKFKAADSHELLSKPLGQIEHEMRSTGTSGIPSISRRCSETLDNAIIGIYAMYREFFKISKGAGLYLCPSNEEIPEMGMIKALNMFAGLLDTHRFMVREERMVPEDVIAQLKVWENGFTRHIIGPPFLIYRLISFLKATNTRLKLDKSSHVITLGGWKRFTGQMISRKEFNEECAEYLGIEPTNVRDIYGLVESNVLAIEDEFQIKHVAPYAHLSVRDPNDLSKEVPMGEKGQLAIFDPLAISTPGMILTEDIVYLIPEKSPSGRSGQRMKYVMRAPASKEFGCCAVNLEKKMDEDEQPSDCPVAV
jgi:long-chain-fatty-acid---luciferin-component ligase